MPTLYLIPPPLGDPDDISFRALRILRTVSVVATHDQAAAQGWLRHHQIDTPIIAAAPEALERGDVALIAPTPAAAHDLVQAALARGVRVEPLPGANAAITALVLSGLPSDAFADFGALPADLSRCARERHTMIFSASHVAEALARLLAAFGDRRVCVVTRLTQPDEVVYRGTARAALAYFRDQPAPGEAVLVVAGAPEQAEETWDEARVRAALRARLAAGAALRQAAKSVAAQAGWDRRTVYALGVEEKGDG